MNIIYNDNEVIGKIEDIKQLFLNRIKEEIEDALRKHYKSEMPRMGCAYSIWELEEVYVKKSK